MFQWIPKSPSPLNLDKAQAQQFYKRRIFCLIGTAVLGCVVAFYLPSNSIPAIVTIIVTALLFLLFYIRWRKFFLSYWSLYSHDSFYYEDYSWKDSLIIALILLTGLCLSGFALFYLASRVDFTKVQPLALWLRKLI